MLTRDEILRLNMIHSLIHVEQAQNSSPDAMSIYLRLSTIEWLAVKLKETNEELLRATEI
jgi:hypothetical protein